MGAGDEFRFELDLHRRAPYFQIDVLAGTNYGHGATRTVPSFVNFLLVKYEAFTWRKYADRRIDIFKIDCEVLRVARVAHTCKRGLTCAFEMNVRLFGCLEIEQLFSPVLFKRSNPCATSDGAASSEWPWRCGVRCPSPAGTNEEF